MTTKNECMVDSVAGKDDASTSFLRKQLFCGNDSIFYENTNDKKKSSPSLFLTLSQKKMMYFKNNFKILKITERTILQ